MRNKKDGDTTDDHISEYSKAMLWHGLFMMCNLDAERENDGPQMIRICKMCIPQFWSKIITNTWPWPIDHWLLAGMQTP